MKQRFSRVWLRWPGLVFGLAAALAGLVLIAAPWSSYAAAPCTLSWDGGAGTTSWETATNWNLDRVPVAGDHVCIGAGFAVDHASGTDSILSLQSSGALTLSGGSLALTDTANDSNAAAFTHSGGTLGGTGTLLVQGSLVWTGGQQADTGRTVVLPAATATITGSVTMLHGRTFRNEGTLDLDGYLLLRYAPAGELTLLENTGLVDLRGNHTLDTTNSIGEVVPALVHNTGTVIKSTGAGTTIVRPAFDNDGTAEARSGTLLLTGGSGAEESSGTYGSADADGSLSLAGDTHTLAAGATIAGPVALTFATLILTGDVTVAPTGVLTQSSGRIGGTGTLLVEGSLVWSGGEQTDTGSTLIAPEASATINGAVTLRAGRTFRNEGTLTWTNGTILLWRAPAGQRTLLDNAGVLDAQGDDFLHTTGGPFDTVDALVHNTGTFLKSAGASATTLTVAIDNDGVVKADSGTLSVEGGDGPGETSGDFGVTDAEGTVRFGGGSFTLADGITLAGLVELGAPFTQGPTLTVAGDATVTSTGVLTHWRGTLGGTGTLRVEGSLVWTEGEQVDAGRTLIAPEASATINGSVTLRGGRTFRNEGTLTWTNGHILLRRAPAGQRSLLENAGLLDVRGDDVLDTTAGPFDTGDALVHNTGTFLKSAGAGTTFVRPKFDNDGRVEARSGTLLLQGEFPSYDAASRTLERGTYAISATFSFGGADIATNAATVVLDGPSARILDLAGANGLRRIEENASTGGLMLANGASHATTVPFANRGTLTVGADSSFAATGTYEQAEGATLLETSTSSLAATGATVEVSGGTLAGIGSVGPVVSATGGSVAPGLSAGVLTTTGAYSQSAGGVLDVEIGGYEPGVDFDRVEVTGAASLGGTLRIHTVSGFVPADGDSFRILAAAARSGEFASLLGADVEGGLAYTAEYDDTGVTLVVSDRSVSIGDAEVVEGNSGTQTATFTVTLGTPRSEPVDVQFSTANGSAVAPNDFATTSGTITFTPGEIEKTIAVPVQGDMLDEDDETFFVDLSDATNAVITKARGVGTILDDDPLSSLSISDAGVTEGHSGTVDASFTVTLAPATGRTVSVGFATADGTATAPSDYAAKAGTLTFAAGETTKTVSVQVRGDTQVEPAETFFVDLSSPVKAELADARGAATITDDDAFALSIVDTSVTEGSLDEDGNVENTTAELDVTLSAPAAEEVTVAYSTASGTATAGVDYDPASGSLTFAPGETSKTIDVTAFGDTEPESNETFFVDLSSPVNAVLLRSRAQVTIVDDGDESGTPDFQLLMEPSFLAVPPGGSATFTIKAAGLFGFADPITLSALDLPEGISASFSQNPLTPLPAVAQLTLTASADADGFTEQGFVLRGTGGGITHELLGNASVNFGLEPLRHGAIDGYVTDAETGAPIPDAELNVGQDIRTDASGYYRSDPFEFDEQDSIDWIVIVESPGYWTTNFTHPELGETGGSSTVTVLPDNVKRVDFRLLRELPATVHGTVVEGTVDAGDPELVHPTSTPIEGATVVLGEPTPARDTSAADGSYRLAIRRLLPGNQPRVDAELQAFADGYWARDTEGPFHNSPPLRSPIPVGTIHPGDEKQVLVALVRKCRATVSGTVVDAVTGLAVAGARVSLEGTDFGDPGVATDGQGEFEHPRVLLGYNNTPIARTVSVDAPGYFTGFAEATLSGCGEEQQVGEVRLRLVPPRSFGALEGHVRDAETGEPLPGAKVFTPVCAEAPGTTCATTDGAGFYSLPAVPFPVLVDPPPPSGTPFDAGFLIAHVGYYTELESVEVAVGETTERDFELIRQRFARIRGVVRDVITGEPVPEATGGVIGHDVPVHVAADGSYLTGELSLPYPNAPSSATVRFAADGYWPRERSAAIQADRTADLDFELLPICTDATVLGRVTNARTGAGIPGATVLASGRGSVLTDADGNYVLDHLRVGTDNSPIEVELIASAPGFRKQKVTVTLFCGAVLRVPFGTPRPPATIVVEKATEQPAGDQEFRFQPVWTNEFSLGAGESRTFSNLLPGSGYSVQELAPEGWELAGANCSDGSPVTHIDLAEGETVTCTFTNRRLGAIVVRKETDPTGGDQRFEFERSWGDDFSLADGESTTSHLTPGSGYSVSESAPDGWELTGATCDDGSPVTDIELAAGETVTCTFSNRQLHGEIVVRKETDPAGGDQRFEFERSWGDGFSLADGESTTSRLAPGSYSVGEAVPDGWELTGATCDDGSPVTGIELAAGETVTCTFSNRQLGTIIIRKETDPSGSDQRFEFERSWGDGISLGDGETNESAGLTPGSGYGVQETVPDGWKLASATCDDGSPVSNIDLAPGETVTCTFSNTELGTIVVVKETRPAGSSQRFALTTSWAGQLLLAHGEPSESSGLEPGSGYTVAEAVPAGWRLLDAACDDGSPVTNVDLAAGETVTCTFTNRKVVTVTADDKSIEAGDPDPEFTFTYSGLLDGDDSGDVDRAPTCGVSGAHAAAGSYAIACSGAEDDDYLFMYVDGTLTVTAHTLFLLLDEDAIDNGSPPNSFKAADVNDDIAAVGQRRELRRFAARPGTTIDLYSGRVGDEGWFTLKTVPSSWAAAGPTSDGVVNLVRSGPGLGGRDARGRRETLLDKIPKVTPLRATGLELLVGRRACALVWDSDISINYNPLDGSLKGANLGLVAFEVTAVKRLTTSSSSLPRVTLRILRADDTCGGPFTLLTDAPEPTSSSSPFDVVP